MSLPNGAAPSVDDALQALRAAGACERDPVRFLYLEALARRLPGQPPAVRQVLEGRLQAAIADCAALVPRPASAPAPDAAPASPLAALNRELGARARADAEHVRMGEGASLSEMKSVRAFSEAWSRIAAEQQVAQALQRAPGNAGPLNPHKLMLRSLGLMRGLSPDYLRRFMAQADTLLWLEREQAGRLRPAARPARGGRVAGSASARSPAPAGPGAPRSSRR